MKYGQLKAGQILSFLQDIFCPFIFSSFVSNINAYKGFGPGVSFNIFYQDRNAKLKFSISIFSRLRGPTKR